jgi:hypothetical protein
MVSKMTVKDTTNSMLLKLPTAKPSLKVVITLLACLVTVPCLLEADCESISPVVITLLTYLFTVPCLALSQRIDHTLLFTIFPL